MEFYTIHHANVRFNASNQRYWLQYHSIGDIATPTPSTTTHLIRPSDISEAHAARHQLVPFCHWINLLHRGTLIHGPFEFASVNGRKTRDRISPADWDALAKFSSLYQNPLPRFDLPLYSIHVDRGVHSTFAIKPMQMHYAPLPIAPTIVFISDDKRLSGDNAIVSPFF